MLAVFLRLPSAREKGRIEERSGARNIAYPIYLPGENVLNNMMRRAFVNALLIGSRIEDFVVRKRFALKLAKSGCKREIG